MEKSAIFWSLFFGISAIRYLLIAGIAFLIFYSWKKSSILRKKIQQKWPLKKDYLREVGYSLLTFGIFATIAAILRHPAIIPYTRFYPNISDYGWIYFTFSIILSLLIHDTYFYWMHRIIHHPRLFKLFHITHHKSTNPSPWASFSFQPSEAFLEAFVLVIIVLIIPIHKWAVFAFLMIMTLYNVYGHLGFEVFPKWVNRHPILKWLNTSVNHNMHHQFFYGNYGLYFRFWDELMGTTHKKYNDYFQDKAPE